MIILLGIDGVLVNFNGGVLKTLRKEHSDAPYKNEADLTEFFNWDNYLEVLGV